MTAKATLHIGIKKAEGNLWHASFNTVLDVQIQLLVSTNSAESEVSSKFLRRCSVNI